MRGESLRDCLPTHYHLRAWKEKKKAIDDLARVAGVERAGLGDWEEGKKRGGGIVERG